MRDNRTTYVKSPWMFDIRSIPIGDAGPGQILVKIEACGICGTDIHTADRMADDWTPFGHEMAGEVVGVGDGVTRFVVGDRVALNTAAPCGKCPVCLPPPYGKGRPELCRTPATYWGGAYMGFGDYILSPAECAVMIPAGMTYDVASLVEPMGVSIDLVETADVEPGDNVLIVGPGPLGLGAIMAAKCAGANRITLAGRSGAVKRMAVGKALGADRIIEVDHTGLTEYQFGDDVPNKILVTSPPKSLIDAMSIAPFGATIAYIGIAWSPESQICFDADEFHFKRLSLKASFASPDTQSAKSMRLLQTQPQLGKELISHRFRLEEIEDAMLMSRDDHGRSVVKMVMTTN